MCNNFDFSKEMQTFTYSDFQTGCAVKICFRSIRAGTNIVFTRWLVTHIIDITIHGLLTFLTEFFLYPTKGFRFHKVRIFIANTSFFFTDGIRPKNVALFIVETRVIVFSGRCCMSKTLFF